MPHISAGQVATAPKAPGGSSPVLPARDERAGAAADSSGSEILTGELKTLLRHYSHYFTGLFGSLLLGFLSFPVFTRIFSVTDYGTLDFIQKIVTLLIAVAKLGFQHSVVRFYNHAEFASDREAAQRYYSTMFFGGILTALTVTIAFVGTVRVLPNSIIDPQIKNLLCFASVLIFLGGVESIQWGFLRIQERTKTYSVAMMSIKAGTLAFIYMLLWLGHRNVYVFFAGAIGAEAAVVTALIVPLFRHGWVVPRRLDLGLFRTAACFGAPLIVYELANIILDSGDRFLVRRYLGGQLLGYYSVAYNIAGYTYQLVLVPLNLALVPMYMKLWTTKGAEETVKFLSRGLDLFLMLAVGLLCTITVTAQDIVIVLASGKYRGSAGLISIIAAGLLIYATLAFVAAGLLIYKKTFTMVLQITYAAAANLALNCLLLPVMGIRGAAIATLLGYALCILLLGRSSFRILPLRLQGARMARYVFAGAISVLAVLRLDLGRPLLNVMGRGLLSQAIYFAIIAVSDRRLREEASGLGRRLRKGRNPAACWRRSQP
jgi:O-antigen/teichoic acid export membrane protein